MLRTAWTSGNEEVANEAKAMFDEWMKNSSQM